MKYDRRFARLKINSQFMMDVGLEYLTLDRKAGTLNRIAGKRPIFCVAPSPLGAAEIFDAAGVLRNPSAALNSSRNQDIAVALKMDQRVDIGIEEDRIADIGFIDSKIEREEELDLPLRAPVVRDDHMLKENVRIAGHPMADAQTESEARQLDQASLTDESVIAEGSLPFVAEPGETDIRRPNSHAAPVTADMVELPEHTDRKHRVC